VSGFERLHPAVQFHVVNSLGWPQLRPLQEQSLGPILDGDHALLIAPTAGGKTEAAVLPVLSRMLTEDWQGVSVLYICPIKALLNNLEARLSRLGGLVGRRVQLWHGDISVGEKRRAERDLPDILLTTPESLEGILIGAQRDHDRVLGNVRCVVIDELHAFAGDDRGWHILALLERIRCIADRELQRIGLSATVGEPEALLNRLAGHCGGRSSLVRIPALPAEPHLQIDYVGSIDNAATVISQLHQGEKRLVFCDSRSKVEELSLALRNRDINVFVSHAALSVDTRRQAEEAFSEGQNCVIVATSTLELGLDVGDLDRVIQINAPGSIASFLQRLGRSGRRPGTTRNMLFLVTHDQGFLESLAITILFRSGYVEPVIGPPAPYHILVQQLFGMIFERGLELPLQDFKSCLGRVPEFRRCLEESWQELLEHLEREDLLSREGDCLRLGRRAEKRFKGKGLADLCVSFESPRAFTVLLGNKHIGEVDPSSLTAAKDGPRVLALGGRSWRVTRVDWSKGIAYVEPAETGGKSRWIGEARGVSKRVAGAVRAILADETPLAGVVLTRRAHKRLDELRAELQYTLGGAPLHSAGDSWEWWTYAGFAANVLLSTKIEAAGGSCPSIDSYSARIRISPMALDTAGGWSGVSSRAAEAPRTMSQRTKFAEFLPQSLTDRVSLARLISAATEVMP
jgi:ATP-dependent Lhr-like helicase